MRRIAPLFFFLFYILPASAVDTTPSFLDHYDYFLGAREEAGKTSVWNDGTLVPLVGLNAFQVERAREALERFWMTDPSQVPGGDFGIRQMLRAIRYYQGPNLIPAKAACWKVRAVVVPSIHFDWIDAHGQKQHYDAVVKDPAQWATWIDRELRYLRRIIFVASWGKIWIQWKVGIATTPLTRLSKIDGDYFIDLHDSEKVFRSAFPNDSARGWMAWLSTDGIGKAPPWTWIADTDNDPTVLGNAQLTMLNTSKARLRRPHGWAETGCCGLMHELWQQVHYWTLSSEGFPGFIPDNDTSSDVTQIENEIQAQELPAPYTFYADFFGSFPPRAMLEDNEDCD